MLDTLTKLKNGGLGRITVLTTAALVVAGISAGMAGAYGPQADGSSYGRTPVRTPAPTTGYGTPAPTRGGYGTTGTGGLSVSFPATKLAGALSKGIEANVNCASACSVVGKMKVDAKTAKRLKIGRAVGSGKGSLKSRGIATLHLKFNKKAARALKKVNAVKLTLTLTAGTAKVVRTLNVAR